MQLHWLLLTQVCTNAAAYAAIANAVTAFINNFVINAVALAQTNANECICFFTS